jgi:leucyl aminopeptidase (aminopeptidase T)
MSFNVETIQQAVKNMLAVNMKVQPGEKVLFATDVPLGEQWNGPLPRLEEIVQRAIFTRKVFELAKEEFPQNVVEFQVYPTTGQHGTEPAAEIAEKMLHYDVVILMNSYSLSHTNARMNACKHGARIASMPDIEPEMFLPGGPMQADYGQVGRETAVWAAKVTAASQVRVVTARGTDLTFSVAGRKGLEDHGLFGAKGDWGNLPAGEAYTAPVEGSANGTLVAPAGWYPKLDVDFILKFENGYVVSAEGGGAVGDQFRQAFHFGDPAFQHRRNCAELGIGTNPNAKRADNVLEAEKIRGTIHVAVGDSAHMGGKNESDMHEDFIIPEPTMYFDGVKVMG